MISPTINFAMSSISSTEEWKQVSTRKDRKRANRKFSDNYQQPLATPSQEQPLAMPPQEESSTRVRLRLQKGWHSIVAKRQRQRKQRSQRSQLVQRPSVQSHWGAGKSGFWTQEEKTREQEEREFRDLIAKQDAEETRKLQLEYEELNEKLLDFWAEFENELLYHHWPTTDHDDAPLFTVQANKTSLERTYCVMGVYTIRITPGKDSVDPAIVKFRAMIDYDYSALSAGTRGKMYTDYDAFFEDVDHVRECAWDV